MKWGRVLVTHNARGHRQDLAQVRRLGRAASGGKGGLVNVTRSFLAFWRRETSTHFRKEEEALLPGLARHVPSFEVSSVTRMLTQHDRIRGLVMQLSDEEGSGESNRRRCEVSGRGSRNTSSRRSRRSSPLVEETVPERDLQEVASRLAAFEAGSYAESWVPAPGLFFAPYPGLEDSEGGGGIEPP